MLIQMMKNDISALLPYLNDDKCSGNEVLLMQSGVYAIDKVSSAYPQKTFYVLESDLDAAGIGPSVSSNSHIKRVSHAQWISLTIKHKITVSIQ